MCWGSSSVIAFFMSLECASQGTNVLWNLCVHYLRAESLLRGSGILNKHTTSQMSTFGLAVLSPSDLALLLKNSQAVLTTWWPWSCLQVPKYLFVILIKHALFSSNPGHGGDFGANCA